MNEPTTERDQPVSDVTAVTPEQVTEANAADVERLLLPVMDILAGITHRNLTSKSALSGFLVHRSSVMALKEVVDQLYPGLYEHMRELQKGDKDV